MRLRPSKGEICGVETSPYDAYSTEVSRTILIPDIKLDRLLYKLRGIR